MSTWISKFFCAVADRVNFLEHPEWSVLSMKQLEDTNQQSLNDKISDRHEEFMMCVSVPNKNAENINPLEMIVTNVACSGPVIML